MNTSNIMAPPAPASSSGKNEVPTALSTQNATNANANAAASQLNVAGQFDNTTNTKTEDGNTNNNNNCMAGFNRSGSPFPSYVWAKVTPPSCAVDSPASPQSVEGGLGMSATPTTSATTVTLSPLNSNQASAPAAEPMSSHSGGNETPKKRRTSSTGSNRKRGVPHVYHDFAHEPEPVAFVRKKTGGVSQPFPEKLHELLDSERTNVVGWSPHGRSFIVRKPKDFTRDIMPKYFRQTKLTSFQRQLNLYGFRRITQGADAGAYYHELFLRGKPQLCMRMQRQKVKGTGHKQPSDARTEPNFYEMSPSNPIQSISSPYPNHNNGQAHSPSTPTPMLQLGNSFGLGTAMPPAQQSKMLNMSPGLQGVHSAAHLLKGMAAGVPAATLNSTIPFSLGVQNGNPAGVNMNLTPHHMFSAPQLGGTSTNGGGNGGGTNMGASAGGMVSNGGAGPGMRFPFSAAALQWPPPSQNQVGAPSPHQQGPAGVQQSRQSRF